MTIVTCAAGRVVCENAELINESVLRESVLEVSRYRYELFGWEKYENITSVVDLRHLPRGLLSVHAAKRLVETLRICNDLMPGMMKNIVLLVGERTKKYMALVLTVVARETSKKIHFVSSDLQFSDYIKAPHLETVLCDLSLT